MRAKLLIFAEMVLVVCGLALMGCKKPAQKAQIDPHSPQGLVQIILDQRALLREGVRAKDYNYVDDRAFYLQGVARALYEKLEPEKKQQMSKLFNDVFRVAEELDHAAGRKHEPAVVASMEKLEGLLKELEAQFPAKTQG